MKSDPVILKSLSSQDL